MADARRAKTQPPTLRWFVYAPAELPTAALKLKPVVAEARDVDVVFDAVSERWGGRIASLRKRAGSSVPGLLYDVSPHTLEALHRGTPTTRKLEITVTSGKTTTSAIAMVAASPATAGAVSEPYLRQLVAGAQRAGLPRAYVNRLKAEEQIVLRVQHARRRPRRQE